MLSWGQQGRAALVQVVGRESGAGAVPPRGQLAGCIRSLPAVVDATVVPEAVVGTVVLVAELTLPGRGHVPTPTTYHDPPTTTTTIVGGPEADQHASCRPCK